MNGEPSRRLLLLALAVAGFEQDVLIEKEFRVVSTRFDGIAKPSHAVGICLWALEESAIASEDVVHAILRCSMEFCCSQYAVQDMLAHTIGRRTFGCEDDRIIRPRRISQTEDFSQCIGCIAKLHR